MKKIAIVAQGLSDGGAERVAAILANRFADEGNEVLFVAAYSPDKEYKLRNGIEYIYIESKAKNKLLKLTSRAIKINKIINKFNADVIISFIINEMIICNLRTKASIIYTLRIDPAHVMRKTFNRVLCIFSYNRADKIVFQTPGARDYFSQKIRNKGAVIGNPLTRGLPYWNKEEHKKIIISACRLTEQKNLKMLISAYSEFRKIHPDYLLKIYGNGPLKNDLIEYCRSIGIEKYVEFPGHSRKIHSIMAESAIFSLTSNFEGLSNSMLEALAIGLPTVCTDCPPGGASLYINDKVNGMLVPVGDVEELYNRFCLLADNESLCKVLSRESIKIREQLDEDIIMAKWNDLLG